LCCKILEYLRPFKIPSSPPCFRFLELLLDYHAKTRTLNIYISTLFESLTCLEDNKYQVVSTSPLMLPMHLDRLAKCAYAFLTPTQVVDVVDYASAHLKQFSLAGEDEKMRSKKRQKLDGSMSLTKPTNPERRAIQYSLCSRIVGCLLPSLPMRSLTPTARVHVDEVIAEICGRSILKTKRLEIQGWHAQIIAAANLRLQYHLQGIQQLQMQINDSVCKALLDIVSDERMLPELALESVSVAQIFHKS